MSLLTFPGRRLASEPGARREGQYSKYDRAPSAQPGGSEWRPGT
jgi:hypothetical protein